MEASASRGRPDAVKVSKSSRKASTTVAIPDLSSDSNRAKREVVIQGFERKSGLGKRVAEELERGVLKVACPNGSSLLQKDAYKEYTRQYKRLCTHLRQNGSLAQRLKRGELMPEEVAAMDDEALMAEAQRSEREQHRQEGLQEALGVIAEDSAHWTPSADFSCPRCESVKCVYIQWFKGFHSYDDNNQEPAITIRCTECQHVWKEEQVDGGRAAAGTFVLEESAAEATPAASSGVSSDAQPEAKAPALWEPSTAMREWLLPASSV